MLFAAILDKIISLGVAAKVGVGVATAASVVAVGGATGVVPVLPEQAQRPAAEQVTTQDAETEDEETASEVTEVVAPTPDNAEVAEVAADEDDKERPDTFGAIVSEDAQDGGVDGATISAEARKKNADKRPAQAEAGQAKADAGRENADEAQTQREQAPAGAPAETENDDETAEDSDDAADAGAGNGQQGRDTAAENKPADDEQD